MTIGLPASTRATDDQIVVSVGPYIFQSDLHRGSSASARSVDQASPPHRIFNSGLPVQPAASKSRQVAGVACITVAPQCFNRDESRNPSAATSLPAMTTRAPVIRGRNSSRPAMSNDRVVTASNVSPAFSPGSRCIDRRKLTSARFGMRTPLGLPVEPEV